MVYSPSGHKESNMTEQHNVAVHIHNGIFSSVTQSCPTLCNPMNCSMPSLPVHHQLPEFTQTHVHRVGDAIEPSHPLSSPFPPNIRVFSSESTLCMRWPKYWSFSFSIRPSKEHPGLISFRMDCLDLPAVQGILKSLLQHHNSKASILRYSAFFTVQLSHPYYSAIKRNVFESVLMRWMNLEPITQSEVSQKEKDTLHLYIYIESIKMILMIPLKYS